MYSVSWCMLFEVKPAILNQLMRNYPRSLGLFGTIISKMFLKRIHTDSKSTRGVGWGQNQRKKYRGIRPKMILSFSKNGGLQTSDWPKKIKKIAKYVRCAERRTCVFCDQNEEIIENTF